MNHSIASTNVFAISLASTIHIHYTCTRKQTFFFLLLFNSWENWLIWNSIDFYKSEFLSNNDVMCCFTSYFFVVVSLHFFISIKCAIQLKYTLLMTAIISKLNRNNNHDNNSNDTSFKKNRKQHRKFIQITYLANILKKIEKKKTKRKMENENLLHTYLIGILRIIQFMTLQTKISTSPSLMKFPFLFHQISFFCDGLQNGKQKK